MAENSNIEVPSRRKRGGFGTLTAPLKWHGGKAYLAKPIIELMPPRVLNGNSPDKDDPGWQHYVEPYFGGGRVLLANDPEGISEVVNDLNYGLINFWEVLKREQTFAELQRRLEATPFSQDGWDYSQFAPTSRNAIDVPAAANFFVNCRQSLAGRMAGFSGITKTRTRRGMNNEVSAWLTAIDGLPAVHERLKRVLILNRPALEVIAAQDGPRTLFYLDPPYLHETRVTTGEYAHEMTAANHQELLLLLGKIQGRFLLSGYPSEMYQTAADHYGWRHVDFGLANHASGSKKKPRKTERVWMNF